MEDRRDVSGRVFGEGFVMQSARRAPFGDYTMERLCVRRTDEPRPFDTSTFGVHDRGDSVGGESFGLIDNGLLIN